MGIEEAGGKSFPAGWNMVAKPCDSCKLAVALLFCRADSAFMCMDCDSKIHGANRLASRHERVWMCEVCEQAPAAVTCKADAAALCVTCDRDIHSANPLARRHERVPVVPFYDTAEAVVKSTAAAAFLLPATDDWTTVADDHPNVHSGLADAEAPASWMDLPNPNPKILIDVPDMKSIELLFSDSDQFLNLDYPIPFNTHFHEEQRNSGADSVVPVQTVKAPQPEKMMKYSPDNCFEMDFTQSKMSSSSMDVGVVPEGSSMSDMSYSFGQNMSSSMDLGGSAMSQVSQPSGLDREARVLRYREKRKNRKFEKTIRYASRKAYAETRPRIKGRFAKRTEVDSEVDQMLFSSGSSGFMVEAGYGVVPSF